MATRQEHLRRGQLRNQETGYRICVCDYSLNLFVTVQVKQSYEIVLGPCDYEFLAFANGYSIYLLEFEGPLLIDLETNSAFFLPSVSVKHRDHWTTEAYQKRVAVP